VPRNSGVTTAGSLERAQGPAQRATPDWQGYQTSAVSTNRSRGSPRTPVTRAIPHASSFLPGLTGSFRVIGRIGYPTGPLILPITLINPVIATRMRRVKLVGLVRLMLGGAIGGGGNGRRLGRAGRRLGRAGQRHGRAGRLLGRAG